VEIPGLGPVLEDNQVEGSYRFGPVAVPVLDGTLCSFIIDGFDGDKRQEDFVDAIRSFLTIDRSVLTDALPSLFAYYRDVVDEAAAQGWDIDVRIESPHDILDHVELGDEPVVSRDPHGDRHVYVSLGCECAWEPEHGLQIVFRDGRTVTKVGPYDGHLTNAAAFADPTLEGVVYHQVK